MSVFVDTSAILAVFDPNDARGAAARAWVQRNGAESMVTHNYVVVELLALAERRLGRAAARSIRGAFLPLVGIHWISSAQHDRALEAHFAASRRSSVVDQVSFVVMHDAGLDTAFAFDDDFVAAGFTVVPG